LNSAASSLKKPDRAPSPIPKKEIRAKLNLYGLREGVGQSAPLARWRNSLSYHIGGA